MLINLFCPLWMRLYLPLTRIQSLIWLIASPLRMPYQWCGAGNVKIGCRQDTKALPIHKTHSAVADAGIPMLHDLRMIFAATAKGRRARAVNQPDMVNHPEHYTSGGVECIDALESAVQGLPPEQAICAANVIKYVWRYSRKNGLQDLQKAEWYLHRLMGKIE